MGKRDKSPPSFLLALRQLSALRQKSQSYTSGKIQPVSALRVLLWLGNKQERPLKRTLAKEPNKCPQIHISQLIYYTQKSLSEAHPRLLGFILNCISELWPHRERLPGTSGCLLSWWLTRVWTFAFQVQKPGWVNIQSRYICQGWTHLNPAHEQTSHRKIMASYGKRWLTVKKHTQMSKNR